MVELHSWRSPNTEGCNTICSSVAAEVEIQFTATSRYFLDLFTGDGSGTFWYHPLFFRSGRLGTERGMRRPSLLPLYFKLIYTSFTKTGHFHFIYKDSCQENAPKYGRNTDGFEHGINILDSLLVPCQRNWHKTRCILMQALVHVIAKVFKILKIHFATNVHLYSAFSKYL